VTPSALLAIAEQAARAGGSVLREKLKEARVIQTKGEGKANLVTDADTASEAVVLEVLGAHAPGHAVLAEESGASGHSPYLWFIDPLDGTTNYAHGVPHFCCTVAVEGPWLGESRAVLAGVVYDPIREECFSAAKGEGATLNGVPLKTASASTLDKAVLCTGFPYDLGLKPEVPLALFNRLVRQAQGIRRMGSAALDLAYVAAGRFDGFFEFGLKPWDIAAGALLIEEATGFFACVDGSAFDPRIGDVVAASAALAPALRHETAAFAASIGWRARPFATKSSQV
jgi:myo-inositol-1(or 4)-monophosphatase